MFGNFYHPHLPHENFPVGVRLGNVTVLPGGSNVHYVRSTGAADYDPPELAGRIHTTVNSALGQCRSGAGDTVVVLEGHTENLSTADSWSSLVAGTTIIGRGRGANRPTFTFSAAASTVLLDVANVTVANCRFLAAGPSGSTALTVTAPFTVSAAGVAFVGNYCQVGIDGDQLCTAFFTTTANADDLLISGNHIDGAAAAEMTTCFKFVGADRLTFTGNRVRGAVATDTDGLLQFATTASTDVLISDNLIHANGSGNKTCIQMSANLANTGWLVRNFCRNMTDANTEWIVTSGTGVDVQLQDNYGINNSNERGLAIGTASA